MKTQSSTLRLTRGAIIAALYAVLSYLTQSFQIAFFQFRLPEALCILPMLLPEAIPGLFIGCLVSNIISGCNPWDTVFGSIATLIGALGAYLLRKAPKKLAWLATVPTILANATIIPFVIIYAYGANDGYWFLFGTVAVGEIVTAGILGTLLYYGLQRTNIFKN
ncbi:MAG: QueT transporter family protein [Clostridia bacterium]|nr:QueT transporter family protein [Clostridia bacterium]